MCVARVNLVSGIINTPDHRKEFNVDTEFRNRIDNALANDNTIDRQELLELIEHASPEYKPKLLDLLNGNIDSSARPVTQEDTLLLHMIATPLRGENASIDTNADDGINPTDIQFDFTTQENPSPRSGILDNSRLDISYSDNNDNTSILLSASNETETNLLGTRGLISTEGEISYTRTDGTLSSPPQAMLAWNLGATYMTTNYRLHADIGSIQRPMLTDQNLEEPISTEEGLGYTVSAERRLPNGVSLFGQATNRTDDDQTIDLPLVSMRGTDNTVTIGLRLGL